MDTRQIAEEEIGMDYETIDPILKLLVDKTMKPKNAARKLGIPANQVNKVKDMIDTSVHKRSMPSVAYLK